MTTSSLLRTTLPLPHLPRLVRPGFAWAVAAFAALFIGGLAALGGATRGFGSAVALGVLGVAVPLALQAAREHRLRRPRVLEVADGFVDFEGAGGRRRVALASLLRLERDSRGLLLITPTGAELIPTAGRDDDATIEAVSAALGRPVERDWRREPARRDGDRRAAVSPLLDPGFDLPVVLLFTTNTSQVDGVPSGILWLGLFAVLLGEVRYARGLSLAASWGSVALAAVVVGALATHGFGAGAVSVSRAALLGAWTAWYPGGVARLLRHRRVAPRTGGCAPYALPQSRWAVALALAAPAAVLFVVLGTATVVGLVPAAAAVLIGVVGMGFAERTGREASDAARG